LWRAILNSFGIALSVTDLPGHVLITRTILSIELTSSIIHAIGPRLIAELISRTTFVYHVPHQSVPDLKLPENG